MTITFVIKNLKFVTLVTLVTLVKGRLIKRIHMVYFIDFACLNSMDLLKDLKSDISIGYYLSPLH